MVGRSSEKEGEILTIQYWMHWPEPIREIFKDALTAFLDKRPINQAQLNLLKDYVKRWINEIPLILSHDLRNTKLDGLGEEGFRVFLGKLLEEGIDPF